jgi:hypothetical protein
MKRFLVVDDLGVRHKRFRRILAGEYVISAMTVAEAIAIVHDKVVLERPVIHEGRFVRFEPPWEFEVIFLDNDIDSGIDRRDVLEFARWVVEHDIVRQHFLDTGTKFFIHSMNVVGAGRIANVLQDAGFPVIVKPFKAEP